MNLLENRFICKNCVLLADETSSVYCIKVLHIEGNDASFAFINQSSKLEIETVMSQRRHVASSLAPPVIAGLEREREQLLDVAEIALCSSQRLSDVKMAASALSDVKMAASVRVLLHGPPGCGKTTLARHLAASFKAVLLTVTSADVRGALPGESEQALRRVFDDVRLYSQEGPTVLLLEEMDSFCGKSSRDARLVSALCQGLDQVMHDLPLIG